MIVWDRLKILGKDETTHAETGAEIIPSAASTLLINGNLEVGTNTTISGTLNAANIVSQTISVSGSNANITLKTNSTDSIGTEIGPQTITLSGSGGVATLTPYNMSIRTITTDQITFTSITSASKMIMQFGDDSHHLTLTNRNGKTSLNCTTDITFITANITGGGTLNNVDIYNADINNSNLENITINGLGLTPAVTMPTVGVLTRVASTSTANTFAIIFYNPPGQSITLTTISFGGQTVNNVTIDAGEDTTQNPIIITTTIPGALTISTSSTLTHTFSQSQWSTGKWFLGLPEFNRTAPFTLLCDRSTFIMAAGNASDEAWFNHYATTRDLINKNAMTCGYGYIFTAAKTSS